MRHISVIVTVLIKEIGARERGVAPARSVGEKQGVNSRRHRIGYGVTLFRKEAVQ